MTSEIDQMAVDNLACPACGAQPGEWCRTYRPTTRAPGHRADWLHVSRTDVLREAWRLGVNLGRQWAISNAIGALRAAREGHWWAQRDGIPVVDSDVIEKWLATRRDQW